MKTRPLSQWLALLIVGVIIATGLASYVFLNSLLGTIATSLINSRARALMETMLAVRQYTEENTGPIIEPINIARENDFMPESVPSYAAMSVFRNMSRMPQYEDFSYKESVVNPTNPSDAPGDLELAIINRFKKDPKLREISGDDINSILSYHYVARPLSVSSQSCLRCHSTPASAPLSLTREYGTEHGFGWKVGETIGAQVVKIPIEKEIVEKNNLRNKLIFLVIILLASLASAILLALHHLVVKPLAAFTGAADIASQSPRDVAIPSAGRVEELTRLQRSLERLRISLLVAMNLAAKP